jgi:hypothetical protein
LEEDRKVLGMNPQKIDRLIYYCAAIVVWLVIFDSLIKMVLRLDA